MQYFEAIKAKVLCFSTKETLHLKTGKCCLQMYGKSPLITVQKALKNQKSQKPIHKRG